MEQTSQTVDGPAHAQSGNTGAGFPRMERWRDQAVVLFREENYAQSRR